MNDEQITKIKEWYESYENKPTWHDVLALLNRELSQFRDEKIKEIDGLRENRTNEGLERAIEILKK